MNKVILMGRLTNNPDFKDNGNISYARFTLAVDRRYKSDTASADFPACVAFGKTAEFINNYFSKGMKVVVEGRLQTGSYTNKDGKRVYTTEVMVENVEFAESKKASEEQEELLSITPEEAENLPFN